MITDLDSGDHTLTPSVLGTGNALKVRLAHKGADDFSFQIEDSDGAIRVWLKKGCIARFYIDPNDPPTTLRLTAMVEKILKKHVGSDFVVLDVEGRELFHILINNRIVTETYLDIEVSEIVQDLMEKYAPEIDRTTYVNVTTTTPDDIRFPYRPLRECLNELAGLSESH